MSRQVLAHLQQGTDICSFLELLLDGGLRAASKEALTKSLSSGDFPPVQRQTRCSMGS